jgi:exodeoxyribonuclease V alpha subunit
MTVQEVLVTLERWRAAGWLRDLDVALARFVAETDARAPASLVLAIALVAHMEGRGHTGLMLPALATGMTVADRHANVGPGAALGWPEAGLPDLEAALGILPADDRARREAWGACEAVEIDPADAAGVSPLVLAGSVLVLRRHWREETLIAQHLQARLRDGSGSGSASHAPVDPHAARALLDQLFPAPAGTAGADGKPPEPAPTAGPDWQKIACALALRGRLTLVTGGPGTGKTYTAARLLVAMQALRGQAAPLRVGLAAPTGKAAARLRQSIAQTLEPLRELPCDPLGLAAWAPQLGPGRTLHALLGPRPDSRRFRHDASHPLALDVLLVDEASMVHLGLMAQLLEALPPQARLVLLGDKDQLSSVEAGAVMGELCRHAVVDEATLAAEPDTPPPSGTRPRAGYDAQTVEWVRQVCGQDIPPALRGPGSALAQQTVMLRRSRRFDGPIGQLAACVNRGDTAGARALLSGDVDGAVAAVAVIEAADPRRTVSLAVRGRHDTAPGYLAHVERLARRPEDSPNPGDPGVPGRTDQTGPSAPPAPASPASPTATPAPSLPRSPWERWVREVLEGFDAFRVLCVRRDGAWGVDGLNRTIEQALARHGLPVQAGEWYEGRPVMVTRNDAALGVFNGDIGIVLRGPAGDPTLRAHFLDGDTLRSIPVGRLPQVETAFAMTVHKSQGSEFGHVALVLPETDLPVLTREGVYTGITRARRALTLVARDLALLDRALQRPTLRVSGLGRRLEGAG